MPEAISKRKLETKLIERCWKDPEFKKAVLDDPKGMLENYVGQKLPDYFRVVVHEEDGNTLHLAIPPAPSNFTELSEQELESVAGGLTPTYVFVTIGVAVGTALITAGAAGKELGGW